MKKLMLNLMFILGASAITSSYAFSSLLPHNAGSNKDRQCRHLSKSMCGGHLAKRISENTCGCSHEMAPAAKKFLIFR